MWQPVISWGAENAWLKCVCFLSISCAKYLHLNKHRHLGNFFSISSYSNVDVCFYDDEMQKLMA
jgi:hypothetical protein